MVMALPQIFFCPIVFDNQNKRTYLNMCSSIIFKESLMGNRETKTEIRKAGMKWEAIANVLKWNMIRKR